MGKVWNSFMAQFNKMANRIHSSDPVAQIRLQYDRAVAKLKAGREGLEEHRAILERLKRQIEENEKALDSLKKRVRSYLKSGDRDTAAQLAIEMKRAEEELAENRSQLELEERAYKENVVKIREANEKLNELRDKSRKHEAMLKMTMAQDELERMSRDIGMDLTTDFGRAEAMAVQQIETNRAVSKVAADLADESGEDVLAEKTRSETEAEDLLVKYEIEMGLRTPETADIKSQAAPLGPEAVETPEGVGDNKAETDKPRE